MGAFDSADAFSQCETLLWDTLEADTTWAGLVRPGNRIKHQAASGRSPYKPGKLTRDLPDVDIIPSGIELVGYTSSAWTILQSFSVVVFSGDMRPAAAMFPVRFQCMRAFYALARAGRPDATRTWIEAVEIEASEDDVLDERGQPKGWFTAIEVTFKLNLPDSEMA